jgi:hypothetical protein
MNIMLNKANLPKVNRIQEKGRIVKNVNLNLAENKYKTLNLKDILSGKLNLDKLLDKIYTSPSGTLPVPKGYRQGSINDKFLPHYAPEGGLYDMVFNSIKYKNLGGIRMEVKGRLTKRYRADRSLFKLR